MLLFTQSSAQKEIVCWVKAWNIEKKCFCIFQVGLKKALWERHTYFQQNISVPQPTQTANPIKQATPKTAPRTVPTACLNK